IKKNRMKMDIIAISVEMVGKPPNGYVNGGYGPPVGAPENCPPPKIIAIVLLRTVRIRRKKRKNERRMSFEEKDGLPADKGPTCLERVQLTVVLDTQDIHAN